MPSVLYRNGVIHSTSDPFAEAVLVADGQIAWLGSEETVHTVLDGADEVVDLHGALVTPGFVDAHAHVLETGFALTGLDLSAGGGVRSRTDLLERVAAASRGGDGPVLGHGWDETGWADPRPPTRAELDRASGGLPVYLARADVHSAVVTTSFAVALGLAGEAGWTEDGLVTLAAHHRAREASRTVGTAGHDALCEVALRAAAAAGIVSIHEHSAPFIDTREGLLALLAQTRSAASGLPSVLGYRGELCETTGAARALLAELPGLAGIGGDLNVDGSLGSRTAALREPYADGAEAAGRDGGPPAAAGAGRGQLMLTAEAVGAHVTAVTQAGSHAAFHVIGDRAMDEVLRGVQLAADADARGAVRRAGHRIEHAEMVDRDAIRLMVALGLTVSVQPAFDAAWGGPDGMYARRLGSARAATLNPFADLAGAGVPLALSSDAPVTPFDPWGGVRAAVLHHRADQRLSARAAFRAHTRGGWRAGRQDHTGAGEIRLGAPASLAVWEVAQLAVQTPDARLVTWSTDPRAGVPLLPRLGDGEPAPRCLRTLRDGVVIHDALG